MPRAPKPEGPVYAIYLRLALLYGKLDGTSVPVAQINRAWKGFYWFYMKHCPAREALLQHFEQGGIHYRTQGWPLPQWCGMFSNNFPILNVLRYGAKGTQRAPTVSRASEERRALVRRKYEEDSANGRGRGAGGSGGDNAG